MSHNVCFCGSKAILCVFTVIFLDILLILIYTIMELVCIKTSCIKAEKLNIISITKARAFFFYPFHSEAIFKVFVDKALFRPFNERKINGKKQQQ